MALLGNAANLQLIRGTAWNGQGASNEGVEKAICDNHDDFVGGVK